MNVTGTPPMAWSDDDRRRFFATLHDVGSTFRRLDALNADLEAVTTGSTRSESPSPGPTARSRPGRLGRRSARVGPERPHRGLIESGDGLVSSEAEARDLLLGLLAAADFTRRHRASTRLGASTYSDAEPDRGAAEA